MDRAPLLFFNLILGRFVNETIGPATQRIILKIVGFLQLTGPKSAGQHSAVIEINNVTKSEKGPQTSVHKRDLTKAASRSTLTLKIQNPRVAYRKLFVKSFQ